MPLDTVHIVPAGNTEVWESEVSGAVMLYCAGAGGGGGGGSGGVGGMGGSGAVQRGITNIAAGTLVTFYAGTTSYTGGAVGVPGASANRSHISVAANKLLGMETGIILFAGSGGGGGASDSINHGGGGGPGGTQPGSNGQYAKGGDGQLYDSAVNAYRSMAQASLSGKSGDMYGGAHGSMFGTCGGMGGLSGEITIVLGAAPRPAFIGRGPTTINNGSIEHIGVSLGGLGGRAGQAGLDGGPGITAIVYDENDIVLPFGPSPVYKFPLSEVQTGNRIERLGWGVEFTVPGQWRIYLRNNYNGKFRGDVSFWTKDNDPAGTYGELNGALQKWAQGDAPTYTIKQEVNSWQSLYNGSIAAMQPGTRYGCIVEHHNHVSAIFVQRNADDTIEFGSELIQEWPWFDAYTTKLYYMPGGTRIDRGGFRWEYDSGYDTLATRVATSDGTKFYGEIETWYTSSSALLESSIGGYRANPNAPSARITSEQLGYTLFAAVTTAAGVDEKQGRVVRWTDYKTGKQSVWAIWWSKSYNIEFTFVCEELPKYEWIDVYEKHLAGVPLGVFARAGGVGWEYDGTYVYIFGRTRDSADKFYGTIKCWFRSNYLDENIASWQASPAQQELTLVDGPGEIRLIGVPFTTGAGRKVGAVIEWNKKVFALWWETNPVNGDFSCACDPIEQYL